MNAQELLSQLEELAANGEDLDQMEDMVENYEDIVPVKSLSQTKPALTLITCD